MTKLPLTSHYRKECLRLEKDFGPFLPRRANHPFVYYNPAVSISWEAFGLASDLRNAEYTGREIEAITKLSSHVTGYHWHYWFPELVGHRSRNGRVYQKPPNVEEVRALLDQGLPSSVIISRLNITRGQVSGIRHRYKKEKERCKTPTLPRNPAFATLPSPSRTPGHTMSIATSTQRKPDSR